MPDYSTQAARPGIEREELELDVLLVGAGPANLACLWRLLDLVEVHRKSGAQPELGELTFGLIEKADEIGDHAFSGAEMDPRALQELDPDHLAHGFPLEGRVQEEEVWHFSKTGGFRFPILPPTMRNHGNYILSLSRMVRWMATRLEERQVEGVDVLLLPGFAGQEVLWEGQKVLGVQTADKGVNTDGTPRSNFEPGNRLLAKVTVFGEGPRGHLVRQLEERLQLMEKAVNPQVYETGAKEVWEIPNGRVPEGFVLYSMGWPQPSGESGGGFVYRLSQDRLAVGYVASLGSEDPQLDVHRLLQAFKEHPKIASMLEGGKLLQYGAKALPIGGWNSMPRLAFEGGLLVGDSAQMVNAARLKGLHLGIKAGMLAAEAIFQGLLKGDLSLSTLEAYSAAFMGSWAGQELRTARNFHQSVERGLNFKALVQLGSATLCGGWVPGEPLKAQTDAAMTRAPQSRDPKALVEAFKGNGTTTFSKLDDVYLSGTAHDEHQPPHLKIVGGDAICAACWTEMGSPCVHFCPAQVYEMHPAQDGSVERVAIAYSNCVHCKTCDIKCPKGNVVWTPPEGGGGPRYTVC